jgi:hypothetical protein
MNICMQHQEKISRPTKHVKTKFTLFSIYFNMCEYSFRNGYIRIDDVPIYTVKFWESTATSTTLQIDATCPSETLVLVTLYIVSHSRRMESDSLSKGGWITLYKEVMVKKNQIRLSTRHKGRWGSGSLTTHTLTLSFRWGEWSISRPSHYTPGESSPATHITGGSVYPTAGSGGLARREIGSPSLFQPVA